MEAEGKDLFASKAFWGAVIIVLAPALRAAGVEYEQQAVIDALTLISGALLTLWGTVKRTQPITTIAGMPVGKVDQTLPVVLACLLFVGCSSWTAPQNTEQGIVYAYGSLAAARDTTTQLLLRDRITIDEAAHLQAGANDVRCALDVARAGLGKGGAPKCDAGKLAPYFSILGKPPATPEEWLMLSNQILVDLERQLQAKGAP